MKKLLLFVLLAFALLSCSYFENKFLRIGKEWYEIEDYDNAIKTLNKVLEEEPKSLEARKYIALSYIHLESYKSALAVRRKIIKIDPGFNYNDIDNLLTEHTINLLTSDGNRSINTGFYLLNNFTPNSPNITDAVAQGIYDSQEWQYIGFLENLTPDVVGVLEKQLSKHNDFDKSLSMGLMLMDRYGSQKAKDYVYQQIENNYLRDSRVLNYLKNAKSHHETDYKLGKWKFMQKLFAKAPVNSDAFTKLLDIAEKDEVFIGSGRTENNIAYMVDARGFEKNCNIAFDRAVKTALDSASTLYLGYNNELAENIMLNYQLRVEHCINDDSGKARLKLLDEWRDDIYRVNLYEDIYNYSTKVFQPFDGSSKKVTFASGYYNLLGNWLIDGVILPEHKALYSEKLLSADGSVARWGLEGINRYNASYVHQPDFIDAIVNPKPVTTTANPTNGNDKSQTTVATEPVYKDFKFIKDYPAFLSVENLLITPVFIDEHNSLFNKNYTLFLENAKLDRGIILYMEYELGDDANFYWKVDELFVDTAETVKKIRQALYARRVAIKNDRLGMNPDLYKALRTNHWKPLNNLFYLGINTEVYASGVFSSIHIDGLTSRTNPMGYYSLNYNYHLIWRINGQTIESECSDGACDPKDSRFHSTEEQPIAVLAGCRMSVSREKQAIVFDVDANDCPRQDLHQEVQQKITQMLIPSLQESHEKTCQLLEKAFANETWQHNGGCTEKNIKSFMETLSDTKSILPTVNKTSGIIRYSWYSEDEPPPIIDLKRNGDKLDVVGYYID